MLTMPTISKEEIRGLERVFGFYVKFPESRWNDIKVAEKFDDKGNTMFSKLKKNLITKRVFLNLLIFMDK